MSVTKDHRSRALALVGLTALAVALAVPASSSAAVLSNGRTPFVFPVVNPCTGEAVLAEGVSHVVVRENNNGPDEHINFTGHGTSAGGAKYVVTLVGNSSFNQFDGQGAVNVTETLHLRFNRQGSGSPEDDFTTSVLLHFTANANGELTAQVVKIDSECR